MGELASNPDARLLLLLALLAGSFLFSASEAALFSLSALDLAGLKRDRPTDYGKLSRLLAHPRRILITLLLGNELANVGASALATSLVVQVLGPGYRWMAAVLMFPTILILCELTPKTLSVNNRIRAAMLVRLPLRTFSILASPAVFGLRLGVDSLMRFILRRSPKKDGGVAERDFRRMARRAAREGTISPAELGLVESTFNLADIEVKEIATPREKIFSLPLSSSYEDILFAFKQRQYRRIPVFETDPDHVVGVVHIKDLLRPVSAQKVKDSHSLAPVMRKPLFVQSGRKLDEIFTRLNREKMHMAFVKGDEGEMVGLVTMDDILARLLAQLTGERAPIGGVPR